MGNSLHYLAAVFTSFTDLDNQMKLVFDITFTITAEFDINSERFRQRKSLIKFLHIHRIDVNEFGVGAAINVNDFLPQQFRHKFSDNVICDLHVSALPPTHSLALQTENENIV